MGNEWEIEIFDYEGDGWTSLNESGFSGTPEQAMQRLQRERRAYPHIKAFRLTQRGND